MFSEGVWPWLALCEKQSLSWTGDLSSECAQRLSGLCQSLSNRSKQSRLAWPNTADPVDSRTNAKLYLIRPERVNRGKTRSSIWLHGKGVGSTVALLSTSACRTWRSQHTGPPCGPTVGSRAGWRGWAPSPGGTTECHCHGEYIPSLPPRAVKWKRPALERARMQKEQSGVRWRLRPSLTW